MEFKDLTLFLALEPNKNLSSLLPLLAELECGHIDMTRELLLRVGESFRAFVGGEHYGTEYFLLQFGAMIEWSGAWEHCARAEWLDVFSEILIRPPLGLEWNEHFAELFFSTAGKYPEKAVQTLTFLLSQENVHLSLKAMLDALFYSSPSGRYSPETLDEFAEILVHAPSGWVLDSNFAFSFLQVASQFPEKAVQVLRVLFDDGQLQPRLVELMRAC